MGRGSGVRGAGWGAAVPAFYRGFETTPPVKPPRLGGGAAGRGRCGEPGHSCPRRRGESVSHGRELPGVFAPWHTGRASRAPVPPGSALPAPAADLGSSRAALRSLPRPGGPALFPRDRRGAFPFPSRRAESRQGILALSSELWSHPGVLCELLRAWHKFW